MNLLLIFIFGKHLHSPIFSPGYGKWPTHFDGVPVLKPPKNRWEFAAFHQSAMAKMKEFKLIYHSNMVTMVNIANGYMVMIYMAIVFVF